MNKDCFNCYTYIVRCRDGSFYTGWTTNLEARLATHNQGRGAKYTRSRGPVQLVYFKAFETKPEAMSYEYALKKLSRKEKELLISSFPDYQLQGRSFS